ncbi:MAG: hypothetical protein QGH37_34380, partial [Candidatus Poribacteria bacterium]|nr:hypothetical protein [Candidatus Poribacteria bacterium]
MRLSQLEANGITVANQFDLRLADLAANWGAAGATDLFQYRWYDTPKYGADSLLQIQGLNNGISLELDSTYRVELVENRAKGDNGLPLMLGQPVDLSAGIIFTTADHELTYPRIIAVQPEPNDDNVHTHIDDHHPVVLEFSQAMDPATVMASTLRLIDAGIDNVFGNIDDNHLDLQLNSAMANGLIEVDWHDDTLRGNDSLLEMRTKDNTFSLVNNRKYKIQMVDNQAKGNNGLPLILGGQFDLLSGFEFTVGDQPTLDPIADQEFNEGDPIHISLQATDAGEELNLRLTAFLKTSGVLENLPEGLQIIDNQDGTGALVGQ